jgi:hypothetical protein
MNKRISEERKKEIWNRVRQNYWKKNILNFEKKLVNKNLISESDFHYLDLETSYQIMEWRGNPPVPRYLSEEMLGEQFDGFLSQIEKLLPTEKVWLFFDHYPWVGGIEIGLELFCKKATGLAQFDLSGITALKKELPLKQTGIIIDTNFEDIAQKQFYQLYIWGEWASPCAHLLKRELTPDEIKKREIEYYLKHKANQKK